VNSAQVGILKQADQISFRGFLKGEDSRSLETQITLEILRNLTDQSLEGKLADEQIGGLLVATNLAEGDGTRAVAMGLFDTSRSWSRLAGRFRGELLACERD